MIHRSNSRCWFPLSTSSLGLVCLLFVSWLGWNVLLKSISSALCSLWCCSVNSQSPWQQYWGGGGLPCLFPSSLLNWQPQGAPHAAASLGDLLVDFSIVFNIAPGHKLLSNHPIKCESFCRLVFEVCSKPRRALLSHSLPWFFFLILSGELVAGLSLSVFLS